MYFVLDTWEKHQEDILKRSQKQKKKNPYWQLKKINNFGKRFQAASSQHNTLLKALT